MNLSFLSSFFKKKEHKALKLPQSLLIKELQSIADESNLNIFQNITIYHHTTNFLIPLLIVDQERGIFLFEHKDWSYDDLKNAKIEKATNQDSSHETLAFEKSHDFIKRKFNELTHNDGVPIFNYLLMENLNAEQYEHLDKSFKELLPKDKIMFNDTPHDEILKKLKNSAVSKKVLPNIENIIGTLLIQYAILNNSNNLHLASKEQIDFIDSPLGEITTLKAIPSSGKTNSILLKAILEKLKNPKLKIVIIKPTLLACDIIKQKLLNIIERAIIEVDLTSIEIITANQAVSKSFKMINLIICDDSQFYSTHFLDNIKKSKTSIIKVETSYFKENNLLFTNDFNKQKLKTNFYKTNPHAKALDLISSLLNENLAKDILVISSNLRRKELEEDLVFFIKDKTILLDSSKNLINQDLDTLVLSSYQDINSLEAKHIILLDIDSAEFDEFNYACNLASENLFILYEDECENLNYLINH